MLRSYLRRVRRSGSVGAVHVEVPFGMASGGSARRLDAVRFPHLDNRLRRYRRDVFLQDLQGTVPIELIEVKPKLNRTVIGQLVVAAELVHEDWGIASSRPLRLVAVVTEVDEALARACRSLRIRVEQVRYPTRQLERARVVKRPR
jgi:hypothetical protein